MRGELPRTPQAFRRFTDALAPEFAIISPRGVLTARDPLIQELEAAHGTQGDPASPFRIWIEDYRPHWRIDDLSLVTYQEWQERSGAVTARLSTALFRRHAEAPNGVAWLHVHETWLPGHAAPA